MDGLTDWQMNCYTDLSAFLQYWAVKETDIPQWMIDETTIDAKTIKDGGEYNLPLLPFLSQNSWHFLLIYHLWRRPQGKPGKNNTKQQNIKIMLINEAKMNFHLAHTENFQVKLKYYKILQFTIVLCTLVHFFLPRGMTIEFLLFTAELILFYKPHLYPNPITAFHNITNLAVQLFSSSLPGWWCYMLLLDLC